MEEDGVDADAGEAGRRGRRGDGDSGKTVRGFGGAVLVRRGRGSSGRGPASAWSRTGGRAPVGRQEGAGSAREVTATPRRRWGDGIGGLPRSRSGKGEREEWDEWGGIGGAAGVRVSVSGPRGLSGVAGWAWWVGPVGLMACWARASGGSFLFVSFLFCFVFVSYCFIFL